MIYDYYKYRQGRRKKCRYVKYGEVRRIKQYRYVKMEKSWTMVDNKAYVQWIVFTK